MSARARVLRPFYRLAYRALIVYWFLARPRTRGVKCVIVRGDQMLLVRHTYGPRRLWTFPGGRVRRSERPEDAALREIREELGISIQDWVPIGEIPVAISRQRATLCCFRANVGEIALRVDDAEIAELRWFTRGELESLGQLAPEARRVLRQYH
jgi:NAD+ diphosphatase